MPRLEERERRRPQQLGLTCPTPTRSQAYWDLQLQQHMGTVAISLGWSFPQVPAMWALWAILC